MTDLYALLQVDPRADDEVVRAAYRTLARKHHPDAGGDAQVMAAINEAWAVLGNRKRRAAYDAKRTSASLASTPAEHAGASSGSNGSAAKTSTAAGEHAPQTRSRPPRANAAGETVLDFGRYQGWTIRELARQDPYYLEWLERTPIGRPFKREIDGYLRSTPEAATPAPAARRRRWAFGG